MPLMGLLHWLQSGGVRISDRIGSEVETLTEDGFHFTKVFVQWRSCANDVLCHRFVTFFQIQGLVCWLLLWAAWSWAAARRRSQLRHVQETRTTKRKKAPKASSRPPVSIVVPVKGVHSQSLGNWRTILTSDYGGEAELIFVVDSATDPAAALAQTLAKEMELGARSIKVHVAEQASTCSQKIFNQLAGVKAAHTSSKYVLFLDDDIRLHPDTVDVLVDAMEADPEVLVATGYPLDVPATSASFATYCMMVYHLPLLVAFSQGERSFNIWGGCMMLPLKDLQQNTCGITTSYMNGGYSDDLILASICNANCRKIACPGQALFVNYMDEDISVSKYWNYLRRQLFVLFTCTSVHNGVLNMAMLCVHCYISLAITCPVFTSAPHIILAGVDVAFPACSHAYLVLQEILLLPTIYQYKPPTGPWVSAPDCPVGALSGIGFFVAIWLAGRAARSMMHHAGDMCSLLSPHQPAVPTRLISWTKVMVALIVNNMVIPFCALLTLVYRRIEWSGVVYTRTTSGRVRVVHRKDA